MRTPDESTERLQAILDQLKEETDQAPGNLCQVWDLVTAETKIEGVIRQIELTARQRARTPHHNM